MDGLYNIKIPNLNWNCEIQIKSPRFLIEIPKFLIKILNSKVSKVFVKSSFFLLMELKIHSYTGHTVFLFNYELLVTVDFATSSTPIQCIWVDQLIRFNWSSEPHQDFTHISAAEFFFHILDWNSEFFIQILNFRLKF